MFHPIITTLDGGGEQGRNKQKRYKQTLNHNIYMVIIIIISISAFIINTLITMIIIIGRQAQSISGSVSPDLFDENIFANKGQSRF